MDDSRKKTMKISWDITIIPVAVAVLLCIGITVRPKEFSSVLAFLQNIFINELGWVFILVNLFCLAICIFVAFSPYGKIKLGNLEKPKFSTLTWIGMIFSSNMAGDMLYWVLIEWVYYDQSSIFGIDPMDRTVAERQDIITSYPLFHWGINIWALFILVSVILGFMIHVKKKCNETVSEACRPVLGKSVDGILGKIIDMVCLLAVMLEFPTFIRIGTPMITSLAANMLGVPDNAVTNTVVILLIAVLYTVATVIGMKAISAVSNVGIAIYVGLIVIFLACGPLRYDIETFISSFGFMIQHYPTMCTWLDPMRVSAEAGAEIGFPQIWTIYFYANTTANLCALPFFVAKISEGRTIRNTIIGGIGGTMGATYCAFIAMGYYTIHRQMTGVSDYISMMDSGVTEAQMISEIIKSLPISGIVMVMFIVAMIFLFATTFDGGSMVLAGFCERNRKYGQEPSKKMRFFWAAIIAIIPIAMTFGNTSLSQLQILTVLAAWPMMILLVIMVVGFMKDLKKIDMSGYDPKVGIDPSIFEDNTDENVKNIE